MLPGDERGMHAHFYMPVLLFAYGEQLESEAEFLAEAYIGARNAGYALNVNFIHRHSCMKSQAGEDGELKGGVHAVHIQRGIGLGQAEALGVGQHGGVITALLAHGAEDIVGGAVDNAHYAVYIIGLHAAYKSADDWYSAGG